MGSDDKINIDDGMTMILQYERAQVCLKILTRSDIHLWTIVSSLEDGRYNTLFMRVVLTKDGPAYVTLAWRVPTFNCGYHRINPMESYYPLMFQVHPLKTLVYYCMRILIPYSRVHTTFDLKPTYIGMCE